MVRADIHLDDELHNIVKRWMRYPSLMRHPRNIGDSRSANYFASKHLMSCHRKNRLRAVFSMVEGRVPYIEQNKIFVQYRGEENGLSRAIQRDSRVYINFVYFLDFSLKSRIMENIFRIWS